jgi:ATP-dependent DNA helicase PIF1
VGDGKVPTVDDVGEGFIRLPNDMCLGTPTLENLIDSVYENLQSHADDAQWLAGRTILATTNKAVDAINAVITALFKPHAAAYDLFSADSVGLDDNPLMYPIEYLNSLTVSGMPPHAMQLKIGMIVMLLRNMNPAMGHCNGSRYIVRDITLFRLTLEAVSQDDLGTPRILLLPRITVTSDSKVFPFVLRRRQFPIRPAFAMTINKAQGQSLKRVGVFLPKPVFSHGQLYVAVSRVSKPKDIVFCIIPVTKSVDSAQSHPGHHTKNVVFTEIFDNEEDPS